MEFPAWRAEYTCFFLGRLPTELQATMYMDGETGAVRCDRRSGKYEAAECVISQQKYAIVAEQLLYFVTFVPEDLKSGW